MKTTSGIERVRKYNKKKPKKMDVIIIIIGIYWILFIICAWITFWVKDAVPDALIQYGLGGGAVELIVSGIIEIKRDKEQRRGEHEN